MFYSLLGLLFLPRFSLFKDSMLFYSIHLFGLDTTWIFSSIGITAQSRCHSSDI